MWEREVGARRGDIWHGVIDCNKGNKGPQCAHISPHFFPT